MNAIRKGRMTLSRSRRGAGGPTIVDITPPTLKGRDVPRMHLVGLFPSQRKLINCQEIGVGLL